MAVIQNVPWKSLKPLKHHRNRNNWYCFWIEKVEGWTTVSRKNNKDIFWKLAIVGGFRALVDNVLDSSKATIEKAPRRHDVAT